LFQPALPDGFQSERPLLPQKRPKKDHTSFIAFLMDNKILLNFIYLGYMLFICCLPQIFD
jgi:hypothetical protein